MMHYKEFFQRNYGIFSEAEQESIRNARILIIGCGGIGGTVAVMLARAGVSGFVLVDFDVYNASNMNRQIGCFTDTIGKAKTRVIHDTILRINPDACVETYNRLLSHVELADLMRDADIVFPAADDFAFSIFVFREARAQGKPALLVVPSGTWANVSIITPDSPPPEDIEGVPTLATYEELRDTLEIRKYKFGTYFYVPIADWRIDHYRSFIEDGSPPAQICPTVWICSALGAFEILKCLTGKWKPIASPRYWNITRGRIRVNRINGPNLQTLLVWQRKIMWRLFQTRCGPFLETLQSIWWTIYYTWMKQREEGR